jgi:hypothetical protein
MRRLVLSGLIFFVMGASAIAQVGTEAVILGSVTDQSGAVIPGATVTVRNDDTGFQTSTKSDASGSFEIVALPIGRYTVSVSAQGFATWTLADVQLGVGERKRVSPTLQVGGVTEKVNVTTTVELIQTDTVNTGLTVEQKVVQDLPLNGRNPIQLTALTPGLVYMGIAGGNPVGGGPERGSFVFGSGQRSDQTQFQLDGLNVNAGMDEGAVGVPSIDTIAEFNVETANFSAEHGRMPIQVIMASKSGTNGLHGDAFEFLRNNVLDARNTFASSTPKLTLNQFGGSVGGPIIKDKTFFFFSWSENRIRQEQIYNSTVVQPALLNGDFSSLPYPIKDPTTGLSFPGNRIPTSRMSSASQFFFPYILVPNSPDGRFHAVAPVSNDTRIVSGRIDHQITSKQRIYGRWNYDNNPTQQSDYQPSVLSTNQTSHQNIALNYTYNIKPPMLLSINLGYLNSINNFTSPGNILGKQNLTEEAGINGFPTEPRAQAIGLPSVSFSGGTVIAGTSYGIYTGFNEPWGVPGSLWMENKDGRANIVYTRGKHSLNIGYEYNDRSTFGRHASYASRGNFTFNGQYTGDAFADYLLGYPNTAGRMVPLGTFGAKHIPYEAIYAQDYWNLTPRFTLNFGLRYDYWADQSYVNGNGATFDTKIGKLVASVKNNGQVDLYSTAPAEAPIWAALNSNLWVPATQVPGFPWGLRNPKGYPSPRVGFAWRVTSKGDLVVRAAYGIFASSYVGNQTASSINAPYFIFESLSFSPSGPSNWQNIFANAPTSFGPPLIYAPDYNVNPQKSHEWNVSVQKTLPANSALTLSYVGSHVFDAYSANFVNEVPPGQYANLQASRPYQGISSITDYNNLGHIWYNGLQAKWERRFTNGLLFTTSYAFGKVMVDGVASDAWSSPTPFAPSGYNRGVSQYNRTHVLTLNTLYDLPVGRGRKYLSSSNRLVNGVLGGWEIGGIYSFVSGQPLTLDYAGATLGNGWDTRPNVVGDWHVPNPGPHEWFNPAAFSAPPAYTFGNSGIGFMSGPALHALDSVLMKNFNISESKYFQFRWEMFNALNNVNYNDPSVTFGSTALGQIFSANPAREMQFALKFFF